MFKAMSALLALALAVPASAQNDLVSPCPNVFNYDPNETEAGKWYGIINLTTDTTLYAVWLNVVLESKADILGNWVGEVTTDDNMDFRIENTKLKIIPGSPQTVRFFIQYNAQKPPPKLKAIRFNGKEICDVEIPPVDSEVPVRTAVSDDQVIPDVTTSTTVKPTVTTTTTSYNKQRTTSRQTTTFRPFWTQAITVSTTQTTIKPQYWQPTTAKTTEKPQVWSYIKVDNNQPGTSTVQPAAQDWPQTTRTEVKPQSTTEKNSQPKPQIGSSQQAGNQQTKIQDRNDKPKQNRTCSTSGHHITVKPSAWPNVEVTNNQQANVKGTKNNNKSQTEVKQVVQTHHWSKIPAGNNTGVKVPSRTETTTYVWPENQHQTYDTQHRDTPIYVRPEKRPLADNRYSGPQTWSGSGNSQLGQPSAGYEITSDRIQQNSDKGRIEARPIKRTEENNGNKQSWSGENMSSWTGDVPQSWNDHNKNRMEYYPSVGSSEYVADDGGIKKLDESNLPFNPYQLTTEYPAPDVYKTSNSEEYDTPKKEDKVEYYGGGLPIFYIPNHGPQNREPECGKVLLNKGKDHNRKATSTLEGQWPWQIAVYQQQTSVDFRYICGGTLVSKRHVITAAHCVTKKGSTRVVNKNTLTVYLGKHNLRTSVEGVQVKFVNRILVYPEYDATNFRTDLAILELFDTVTFTDRVQPACLWPEHLMDVKHIVGQKGSVVGWGYEVTGAARQELNLLEMPVVDQQTCINSYKEFFGRFTSDKTYCAGYRESGSACNGDSGGGMFFERGDSWYLRGVVSLSVARQGEYRCDPHYYVVFTDVAKFLPWIQDNIEDYY